MPDSPENDELLVQAIGRGDQAAFEKLVRRHQSWAWRIACRFLGDENEAEEIVQEAFLRLLDASGRYRPTATFRAYFYRIISRLCLDRAKKKKPVYLETIPDSPDPRPSVSDAMIQGETAAAVRSALDTLPPGQRMAIVLRYYEGLSYAEIAAAMDTTTKAAERLLARGREHLVTVLGNRNDFFYN